MPLALALSLLVAAADPQTAAPEPRDVEQKEDRRLLSSVLAFVPGVIVPGLGHRVAGDWDAADKLTIISGSGIAAAVAGVMTLYQTAGDHDLTPLYMSLIFAGGSMWLSSWLADIAGSVRPTGQARSLASESTLAAAVLYGPSFAHAGKVEHLGLLRLDYEHPRVLADGWASYAPGTRYHELHLRAGLKLFSDARRSHLALVAEGLREAGADSDATGHGGALMLEGRLDAGVLAPSLAGLVVLERIGAGAIVYSYDGSPYTDLQAILVLEFGMALALTDSLELSLLYSQRPDKRLGFFMDHGGHFELQAKVQVHPSVRLVGLAHIGAGMDVLAGVEAAAW